MGNRPPPAKATPLRGSSVRGVTAAPIRPTFRGALWLACLLSLPVFLILGLAELLWRAFL